MSTPAAVLFDLDDTLFAHREAVGDAIVAHVRALGHPYVVSDAAAEVEAWRALEELHYHRYLAGELDYDGQRRCRVRDYAARHGVTLAADDELPWFEGYSVRYAESWRLQGDARGCLDALRGTIPGVRLGIITNGELDRQLLKLDAIGVGDDFDVVIASGDVGVAKPDARIFALACQRLGVRPSEAVYVGDRLATDAIGAARAGLIGVWIDRHGVEVAAEASATADELGVRCITSLDQLVDVLG
ncbi:HAD family hydrolase [Humibacter ginsenosidimutans]|uniref:HAD family hydrolase n=1 Tax=Humibacter ginsenosidimutans TaxID=2599293 RepID=A0A5B8M7K6_9MICO|nr:HAD family hydrolase [Humibacter ginsenosidimutans]QDZ16376.1 HAD family hydrolase [Humibacter ginsenosidimutans]